MHSHRSLRDPHSTTVGSCLPVDADRQKQKHYAKVKQVLTEIERQAARAKASAFCVDSCAICLETFSDAPKPKRVLQCGHLFHADCLRGWSIKTPARSAERRMSRPAIQRRASPIALHVSLRLEASGAFPKRRRVLLSHVPDARSLPGRRNGQHGSSLGLRRARRFAGERRRFRADCAGLLRRRQRRQMQRKQQRRRRGRRRRRRLRRRRLVQGRRSRRRLVSHASLRARFSSCSLPLRFFFSASEVVRLFFARTKEKRLHRFNKNVYTDRSPAL